MYKRNYVYLQHVVTGVVCRVTFFIDFVQIASNSNFSAKYISNLLVKKLPFLIKSIMYFASPYANLARTNLYCPSFVGAGSLVSTASSGYNTTSMASSTSKYLFANAFSSVTDRFAIAAS